MLKELFHLIYQSVYYSEIWSFFKCESGAGIRAMLELINTQPHKIVFLGPGCSLATEPIAEAAPYWQAVQVTYCHLHIYGAFLV